MKKVHRLQTRIWMCFFLFSMVILVVLMVLQFIVFDRMYYEKEKEKIKILGDMVTQQWQNVRFSEPVSLQFYQDEIPVRIFNRAGALEESSGLRLSEPNSLDAALNIRKYQAAGEDVYMERVQNASVSGSSFLIYINKIDNPQSPENSLYVYVIDALGPLASVTVILQNQLVLFSVLTVALALIISYFISSWIARPIVSVTKRARRLAEGDYQVDFERQDFAEISQLSDALNHATRELAKSDQMKSDLLANVSHDLRTPLTMIKAYAEMIRDLSGNDPMRRNEHVKVIVEEADWMSGMITDILEYSRIQSGNMHYEMTAFDLSSLTAESIKHFQAACREEDIRIQWEESESQVVYGDVNRIQRVINNLISNAIKHSPKGGEINIAVSQSKDWVCWQVKDHGSGIPPENLERIWEQYFTQSGSSGRESGGMGLGLSIVRGILEAHGAKYGVYSEVGAGTRFWFEMKCDK